MISYRDLAYCDDEQFVWNCYNAILGRDPDPTGFVHHVNALRRGRARAIVARGLLRSPEAKLRGVHVRGVQAAVFWTRLTKVPGLGTILSRIERIKDEGDMRRAMRRVEMDTSKLITLAHEHAEQQARTQAEAKIRRSNVRADEADPSLSPRARAIFEELRIRG